MIKAENKFHHHFYILFDGCFVNDIFAMMKKH
jgi:hypothetical protein